MELGLALLFLLLFLLNAETNLISQGDFLICLVFTSALLHRWNALLLIPPLFLYLFFSCPKKRKALRGIRMVKGISGIILAFTPYLYFFFLDFHSPLIYGYEKASFSKVVFGDGKYMDYLVLPFQEGSLESLLGLITTLASQAQFIGLVAALLGWISLVHYGRQPASNILLAYSFLHSIFLWSYPVDDVSTMILPTWSIVALGWAGLLSIWPQQKWAGLKRSKTSNKVIVLAMLFLLLLWWNTPLHRNANSTALFEVMTEFHEDLPKKALVFTHRSDESKLFCLYYVNELIGPRKDLRYISYKFSSLREEIDKLRSIVTKARSRGRRVYFSILFPSLQENFHLSPRGPYSEVLGLRRDEKKD